MIFKRARKTTALSVMCLSIVGLLLIVASASSATPNPASGPDSAVQASYLTPLPHIPTFAKTANHHMAIAAYFYPEGPGCSSACFWAQLESAAPLVGLVVANPNSGPGTSLDPNYLAVIQAAQAKRIVVLGYVHTSYGSRPIATLKGEVDAYYNWYRVNGIFFDEASTNCSLQSYYQTLHDTVKAKAYNARVVINPGTTTNECYVSTADVILNFEDTYAHYQTWSLAGWENHYPASHFWHIVHTTAEVDMPNAIALAKQRNADWIYVTAATMPNPYDNLPTGSYWTTELGDIGN